VSLPVTKVELAFTQTSPGVYDYQDATSYTRSVEISRGIQRETDTFQAGSCSIVFDNNKRDFDPSYSTGGFYAHVKPQASVRVTSGNQVIFIGFIDSWSFDYQIVADATATAVAYDSISRLSKNLLPAITWTAEKTDVRVGRVLDRSEVAWSSTARQVSPGTITLGTDVVTDGTSAWDYIQQVAQSEGGAAFVAGNGDVIFKGQSAAEVPSSVVTYRTNLCKMPSVESATLTVSSATWTAIRSSTTAKYGTYSALQTTFQDPTDPTGGTVTGIKYYDSSGTFKKNTTYTVSVWVNNSSATLADINLYVAAMTVGTDFMTDYVTTKTRLNSASGWVQLSVTFTPTSNKGLLVFFQNSGTETPTIRADGLLIEASPYLEDYFDGTNLPTPPANVNYSAAWSGTANLSTSVLTVTTTYNASISNSIVLGDNGGTAIPYTDVRVVYASETLYTNVNVVTSAGTVSQSNAANGTAYGIRTLTIDPSLIPDNANGSALANYLLNIYDNPQLRFDSITVALESLQASDQVKILDTDVWDAATITYTPSAVGSAISAYQRIVGVNHTITPDTHRTTFNLAEFGNKFRLDSLVYGHLDQNVLGY
jgi:hypothetical protein